jgi:Holliday junction resolvasome RuvABC endonuclease subunit
MSVRILGIDPSLTATGVVMLLDGEVERAELWATKLTGPERLDHLDAALEAALNEWVDHVAIEGYSFGSPQRMAPLGELGGIYRLRVWRSKIPLTEVAPGRWRKQLFGNGSLPKDRVRVEAWKRYQVEFDSLDVLEAWAVAMALHRQLAGLDKPEPKRRRSVA